MGPISDNAASRASLLLQAIGDADLQWTLLDHMEQGLYIVDRERRILYWNDAAEAISGYTTIEATGRFCHDAFLMHCDAEGQGLCGGGCPLASVIEDGKPRECRVFLRHKHGHRVPVRVRSRAFHDAQGRAAGAIEVFEQISPHRADIAHIRNYGCCDERTGLANRLYGEMKVGQAIDALDRFGLPFGWLRFALDKVDELEHRYGHGFTGAAMAVIARTLEHCLGPIDLVMRWDRAEFAALIRSGDRDELLESAQKCVVLSRCSHVPWWGEAMRVTVSAGGAFAVRGDSLESLEHGAADALAICQSAGGNRAQVGHARGMESAGANPFPLA